jgi:ribosomal protein S19E (S16A)
MDNDLWPQIDAVAATMRPRYGEAVEEAAAELDLDGKPWWLLASAVMVDPEVWDATSTRARYPYNRPQRLDEQLQQMVDEGYLERVAPDRYRLTEDGRAAGQGMMAAMGALFAEPVPADREDLERLTELLGRLVRASLEAPDLPRKTALHASRTLDRGEGQPLMARLNRYMDDLNAHRDDAHIYAWQQHDVNGPAWEALTLVWREEARDAAGLAEQLSFRGYGEEAYEEALQELAGRGWVEAGDDGYRLSAVGRQVREAVEAETDRLFYAPWQVLDEAEVGELRNLLERVRDDLMIEAEAN